MKRLFIIGASILQVPAIKRAKELGYYVGVADYDPHAVGVPLADEFFNVSTIDVDGIAAAAKQFRADGIMTLATDMPMRSIAKAAEACGLPGLKMDAAVKATDKGEMIKAFEAAGVAHPWYRIAHTEDEFSAVLDTVTYPCIMKPLDNAGSRGVVLCHSKEELCAQYDYARGESRGAGVIIEEYMVGHEVSVEIVVKDFVPHVLQVTDKQTTGAPHFVETGHSQPSCLPADDLEKIRDLAGRAALAVGVENGPAHAEIMLTKDGPKMVEIGARMGGGCITTHLVPLSTGVDMIKATMDICMGQEPDIVPRFEKGAAIRFLRAPYGTITGIEGVEEAKALPGVREIAFTKHVGDTSVELLSGADRIGYVIAQSDTPEQAVAICERACELIRFTVT